jgi:Uri superfamily endonuclease
MKKGVYVLVVEAHGEIEVGRLGSQRFAGTYLYVGSALGPGGFRRIARHRDVAEGRNQTRRWHIDHLLSLGQLRKAFLAEMDQGLGLECALAAELAKRAEPVIEGFGASDCRCKTHLFRLPSGAEGVIVAAFRALALESLRLTI